MKLNLSKFVAAVAGALAVAVVSAQPPASDPYTALAQYQFGQSRLPLALIEEQIRKTAPADYGAIEAKLLAVLKAPETPKDAKRYLCRWLGIVGSAACVPAVAGLLTDADLSHPARLALEPLAVPEAGAALRAALPKVKGKLLIGVIASLGVRRDAQAVAALNELIKDGDPLVAGTAIAALGQIGSAPAAEALNQAQVPEPLARALARARIVAASHLASAGNPTPAAAMFRSLMAASQPPAIRVAALKGLIAALPQAEAVQLILGMVQGEDAAMRSATISAYTSSSDLALKNRVAGALPGMKPAGQLILLGVLADLPEVAAREGVLQVLKSATEDNVRVAALECLARHAEAGDVPLLVELARSSPAPVADAARKTLLRLGKPGVDEALVRLIESPRPADRAVVLATLANRRVESALPTLVRLAGGADATLAVEAAKALGVMGKSDQLKELGQLVATTPNDAVRAAAAEAARSICRRAADKPGAAAALLPALAKAETVPARVALIETLVFTGGQPALDAVRDRVRSSDATIRAAAVRALIDWPEATAGSHLLELARTTPDASQAIVLLRDGCLRLAQMDDQPLTLRLGILSGVLEVSKRPEEKKRAMAILAELPSPGALELLQVSAKDPVLLADATQAAIKLSRQTAAVYNRQTLAMLEGLKTLAAGEDSRKQIEAAIKSAQNAGQSPDGFILAWLLAGPYTQEGVDGSGLFDVAFAPEKAGASANWRPITGGKNGLVELDKFLPGDNRVVYLRTDIQSDTEQEVLIEMGSDDGIKVWLNGKIVHANNAVRPCSPGQDKAKIRLKQGANTLLLKITQGGGQWAASCRLRSPDGKAPADVVVAPKAE